MYHQMQINNKTTCAVKKMYVPAAELLQLIKEIYLIIMATDLKLVNAVKKQCVRGKQGHINKEVWGDGDKGKGVKLAQGTKYAE